jgi:hypothetical protein
MNPNYQPARDDDAEWSVLAAMFADPALASRDKPTLCDPASFWQPVGKEVATAMGKGIPLDAVAMGRHMTDKLGNGAVALFSEKVLCGQVAAATFGYWLDRLKRAADRRRIQESAYAALVSVEDRDADIEKVAGGLVEKVRRLGFARSGLPDIHTATELDDRDIPEPDELIGGMLHKGAKMVLGGTSKSMKTWSLMDLAVCLARAMRWWNFVTRESRVLFINFEIKEWSFRARLRKICEAKGISMPANLHIWNLRGYSADLAKLRPKIVERLAKGEYDVVIFDPIYKLYGGKDENSAGDMAELMNEMDKIAVEGNVAVIFGHHFAKGDATKKTSIDRMSGSGVFARDPDTILVLSHHQEDGVFVVDATVRDFKPVEPFCVRWSYPLMTYAPEENPDDLKTADKHKFDQNDLIALIEPTGSTYAKLAEKAKEEMQMPKPTLTRYLRRLVEAKKVTKESTQFGEIYRAADKPF